MARVALRRSQYVRHCLAGRVRAIVAGAASPCRRRADGCMIIQSAQEGRVILRGRLGMACIANRTARWYVDRI